MMKDTMRALLATLVAVSAAAICSCSMMPPPIPVVGSSERVAALAGTWSGDYSSEATGRYGSIQFTLSADSDTAHGEVVMQPRHPVTRGPADHDGRGVAPPPASQALSVAFVHAVGDTVQGLLRPYEDPECDCTLVTKFAGRLRGDRIEGRYSTLNTTTGITPAGEWSVRRKRVSR